MKLAEWQRALDEIRALYRIHGHAIPIPEAMAALGATSRATFYRRLDDLRATGWLATTTQTALLLEEPPPPLPASHNARTAKTSPAATRAKRESGYQRTAKDKTASPNSGDNT